MLTLMGKHLKLGTYDANGTITVNCKCAVNAENVTFHKVEKGLTVQTMDRDANLKGTTVLLVDKELPDSLNAQLPIGVCKTYRPSCF